ncbi:MAG: hypothetical protein J6L92_08840 [Clostridia bacterium]|nr:hypothetical protein [Clostridia bacterium]
MYSIMPESVIYARQKTQGRKITATVGGIRVEGERQGDHIRVERLLSSDPTAFLKCGISPGQRIRIR